MQIYLQVFPKKANIMQNIAILQSQVGKTGDFVSINLIFYTQLLHN